jgi:hypothetical protein
VTVDSTTVANESVTVRLCDVFHAGDCYDVTFERHGRRVGGDVIAVQAIDDNGEPTHSDLSPEQHTRLGWRAESAAVAAVHRWQDDAEDCQ